MRHLSALLLSGSLVCSAQTWQQLPDFPGTARDDASAFTVGGKIYVGTGREVGFGLTNDWYCYDPATSSWSAIASLPAIARQYCSAFALGGKGYLVGGSVNGMASAEVWAYDPLVDSWEAQVPLPEGMSASTAFVIDEAAHLVTGNLSNDLPSTWHLRYTVDQGAWSMETYIPGNFIRLAASFSHGGFGYVAGGADVVQSDQDDMWRYDPSNGAWDAVAPLPAGRSRGDAIEVADGGVFIGGNSTATVPTGYHDDVWHYIALLDQWEAYPAFPPGPRGGAVIATLDGSIYYGTGSNTVDRYNDWWKLEMPVSVPEVPVHGSLTLGPVPADDRLTIRPSAIMDGTVQVFDTYGRILYSERMRGAEHVIPTEEWSEGTYLVTLRSAAATHTKRFTIHH